MMSERHTGKRLLVLVIVIALGLSILGVAATGFAAAQEGTPGDTVTNETSDGQDDNSIIYEFQDANKNPNGIELRNVEYRDGTAFVTLYSSSRNSVAVAEGSISETRSYNRRTITLRADETRTVKIGVEAEAVSLATRNDGFYHEGDLSMITVVENAPTVQKMYWTGGSGALGAILSLSIAVGMIKRQHHNTYKELLSEERVRIEDNRVEGVYGQLQRFALRNKTPIIIAVTLVMYLISARLGIVPSFGDIWSAMGDTARILTFGTIVFFSIAFIPVYALALRLWEPAREFIVSFDVRDALSVSAGSQGGIEEFLDDARDDNGDIDIEELVHGDDQIGISVYAGAPERISDLNVVEGDVSDLRSPGGRTYLARDFDPERNVATGTWPGTAHDAIIAYAFSAIEWNREVMEDESDGFRSLLGGVGATRSAAQSSAAVALNNAVAESTDIDPAPMNRVLNKFLGSTRFGDELPQYDDDDDEDDDDSDDDNENDVEGGDEQ